MIVYAHEHADHVAAATRWWVYAIAAVAFAGFLALAARRERPDDKLVAVAALNFAAALVHAAVIEEHFAEYTLYGFAFAVTAAVQATFGLAVLVRPTRSLLATSAVVNAGIAVVWLVSRTAGLPVGPEHWSPESVGAADLFSTLFELASVYFVVMLLRSDAPVGRPDLRALVP